jgi:very-short-patch-repair endonuclease
MHRKIIPYNPRLKELARQLRSNLTRTEAMLWEHLENKQLRGYDFDRQRPVDEYIVDFFCKDLLLAIEIDGASHDHPDAFLEDLTRQQRLESLGIRLLRFTDQDVHQDPAAAARAIEDWITANHASANHLSPTPPTASGS